MKPIIWIDSSTYQEGQEKLSGWAQVITADTDSDRPWIDSLRYADAVLATARYQFDANILRHLPRLKIIARLGVGYDNIDVKTATALGICVTITADGSTQSVAEHTLALILALNRMLLEADNSVRSGNWSRRQQLVRPDLHTLSLGIIGVGRIGSRVAQIARAGFGMEVLGYDPYLSEAEIRRRGAHPCTAFEELAGRTDILSLHVPGNNETHQMICKRTLAQVKPGALLINTSRGSVIDESSLIAALESGRIGGAGLDVFENEPLDIKSRLTMFPNVILSPHTAGLSSNSIRQIGLQAAEQVYDVLHGKPPVHLLNPESWENRRK